MAYGSKEFQKTLKTWSRGERKAYNYGLGFFLVGGG